MQIPMKGRQLHTLIDSGACKSMIKTDVWKACATAMRIPMALRQGLPLVSLSGHELPTRGVASIVVLGKSLQFYVIDHLAHDMLLGIDALKTLQMKLDCGSQTVLLADREFSWGIRCEGVEGEVAGVHTEIDSWMEEFPGLFSEDGKPLRTTTEVVMRVDTGNARPIRQRPYRMALSMKDKVDKEIDRMLEEGVLRPSSSPWSSPLTIAAKPGGKVRVCADYRKINAVTKKDAHPIPHIQDIFDGLAGSSIFSIIDLKSAYWQIPLVEEDREKSAIITHRGLYEFQRMPFGMCNSPAVWQRHINAVLAQCLGKFAMVYLDDIVVYSNSQQEHTTHIRSVMTALMKHGLTINSEKCTFRVPEVKLLGYIVSSGGIRPDPAKVEAVRDMAPPRDVKGVQRFLGMAGYYRQCIPQFAVIAEPLVQVTRKGVPFEWTEERNDAWEQLKVQLTSEQVMAYPVLGRPYRLYTDASDKCIGGILCQSDSTGLERPIQYFSKQLKDGQLNWPTVEKEAYAVIFALKKLRPYLQGADFVIITDHKPLKSLFLQEIHNTRIQRWAVQIAEYGGPIEYRKGAYNVRADMLSRLEPGRVQKYEQAAGEEVLWEDPYLDRDQLILLQKGMPEYQEGLDGEEDYVVCQEVLYSLVPPAGGATYPRVVVPPKLTQELVRAIHAEIGHQGMDKTMSRLQESYRWRGMGREAFGEVKNCALCSLYNSKRRYPPATAMPIPTSPNELVALDLIGPLPTSPNHNKYGLVLIDHCTGWAEIKPLPDKKAMHVVNFLKHDYIPHQGMPACILTDCGGEFLNASVKEFLASKNIKFKHTSAFHPATNGKCERLNRTIKALIKKAIETKTHRWEEVLEESLYRYRTTPSAVTGYSPFFLHHGRHPRRVNVPEHKVPPDQELKTLVERVDTLAKAYTIAREKTQKVQGKNALRLDNRPRAPKYEVGQSVLLLRPQVTGLEQRFDHGYIVTRLRGATATIVGLNNRAQVVNIDRLAPAVEGAYGGMLHPLTRTQRRKAVRNPPTRPDNPHDHIDLPAIEWNVWQAPAPDLGVEDLPPALPPPVAEQLMVPWPGEVVPVPPYQEGFHLAHQEEGDMGDYFEGEGELQELQGEPVEGGGEEHPIMVQQMQWEREDGCWDDEVNRGDEYKQDQYLGEGLQALDRFPACEEGLDIDGNRHEYTQDNNQGQDRQPGRGGTLPHEQQLGEHILRGVQEGGRPPDKEAEYQNRPWEGGGRGAESGPTRLQQRDGSS